MIKDLYCCFCTKTQYYFILNYRGVEEGVTEGGLKCINKWIQGKVS